MRVFFRVATLWVMPLLLLSGCWLFEDTPAPVYSQPTPATSADPQAGHASPTTPTRDQRTIGPSTASLQRDLRARVSIAAPRQSAGDRAGDADAEQHLAALAADDRDFFEELNKETNTWPEEERNRRAQVLNSRYADYVADHPDDVEALILYGKFLRNVGVRDLAYEVFLAARELDPKIAVVHQQLGNFLAEEGRYDEAYQELRKAVSLAPQEAIYHYQLGELLNIYYDKFLASKTFTLTELNQTIAGEFARAAELAPSEPGFAWRRAECYYDMREPDWQAALAAWETLARTTNSPAEVEIIRLHRARVLIELGRPDEARLLIGQPVHRSLEATRAQLARRLDDASTAPADAAVPTADQADSGLPRAAQ